MTRIALFLSAACALSPAFSDEKPPAYAVTWDGRRVEPRVITAADTPGPPAAGDLIRADSMWLATRGEPTWDLIAGDRDDGLLYRRTRAAREVVGVSVTSTYKGDNRVVVNPLATMTKEEKAGLRGVYLDEWSDDIARSLAGIDFTKTALTVTNYVAGKDHALPALPADVRFLAIEEHGNHGIGDYAKLADLTQLRVLRVTTLTAPLPAAVLPKLKHLRHLEANALDPKDAAALADLTELRTLRLHYCTDLSDVSFVKNCPHLIELDVRHTAVTDLRPADGLKDLTTIRADEAPVKELPASLPGIRQLDLLSTQVPDAAVAAFRKAHPACAVRRRWAEAMREVAAGADRIRVRTGGTCHRQIADEKTLAEEKDPAAVRELLAAIQIEEKASTNHCMCCGEPSVEFYAGDKLVLTLGVHHGVAVRWVEGWPADGALGEESAEKVAKWLAARGVTRPGEDLERNGKQAAAARRHQELVDAAIPAAVRKKLESVKSRDEVIAAFEGDLDGPARAAVYFKMIGCGEGSWNRTSGPDEFVLKALLPRVKPADLAAAIKDAKDPALLAGAGRWLFFEKAWDKLPKDGRDDLLQPVAEHALAHPRTLNRRRTMAELKAIGTPAARDLLRRAFRSEFAVRALDKADATEAPGMVSFAPGQDELERGTDAAQAAKWLAELGDDSIRAEVEKRLARATGDDKALYEAALKKLVGK